MPAEEDVGPPQQQRPERRFFSVQVGAFADRSNAERLATELRKRGYVPYIVESTASTPSPIFTVRLGRYASFEEARKAANEFEGREKMVGTLVISSDLPEPER